MDCQSCPSSLRERLQRAASPRLVRAVSIPRRSRSAVGVASIVENDIDIPNLLKEIAPESNISLIPNVYLEAVFFPLSRPGIQVYSDDPGLRAKIITPHEQRSAVKDTNLNERDFFPDRKSVV